MTKGKFSYRIIKGWILFCNFLYAIAFSRDISAILSCIINILMNILTWKKRMHKKGKKSHIIFKRYICNLNMNIEYFHEYVCMYFKKTHLHKIYKTRSVILQRCDVLWCFIPNFTCVLVPRITLCEMTASTILGNSEVL